MKLNYRSWLCALLLCSLVATQVRVSIAQTNEANPYASLTKGQIVHGFRTDEELRWIIATAANAKFVEA